MIAGQVQRAVAVVAICVLFLSLIYAAISARSCTGLGCTSTLAALVVAGISFAFALLLVPAIGLLKGKAWAPVVNLVMLLPLIAAGFLLYAIRQDIAQIREPRPLDIGIGTSVVTQDLPVMESTIGHLISEMSVAQPVLILEKTLDYGHESHRSKWQDCLDGEGFRPDLMQDFRGKAHNSVQLPIGFGSDLGVVTTRMTDVVGDSGFLYTFTRPGVSSDNSQALIYVEARGPMDGWGMHYLLEHVGTQWKVSGSFCGWIS